MLGLVVGGGIEAQEDTVFEMLVTKKEWRRR